MANFGLIGKKLSHSMSPTIHNFIFKELQIDGNYSLIEIDEIKDNTLNILKEKKLKGFNITVPYKESFINELDFLEENAKNIGAINTIFIKDNKTFGYNTDYFGILKLFEEIEIKNKVCYILGSGGAAKALIVALHDLGASKILVVSRNKENKNIQLKFPYIDLISYDEIDSGNIIINATPLGMFPNIDSSPVKEETLKRFKVAVDLIYNPKETKFLHLANLNGLKTINGMPMLIKQAIKAQEIWQEKKFSDKIYDNLLKYMEAIYETNGN